jgi:hypothetical protein
MNWTETLRTQVGARLESLAREISARTTTVQTSFFFKVDDAQSTLQTGVSCLFYGDVEPDLVELVVTVTDLAGSPVLVGADVCWGHPSGYIEYELAAAPTGLASETLSHLVAHVPALEAALHTAIDRGSPPTHQDDGWTTDGPRTTDPEFRESVRCAIEEVSDVIVEHRHYRAATSPTRHVFGSIAAFDSYMEANARPGDSFLVWRFEDVCTEQALAFEAKTPDTQGRTPRGGAY